MAEKSKKEGFFKNVLKSIKDFDKYEDFALEKPAQALKYLAKLVALFCAIICIVFTYRIIDNMNKLYVGLKDKIPEFSYENGKLNTNTEKATIIEDYTDMLGTVIIDTKIDNDKVNNTYYEENIKKHGSGFVFTKDQLIIYNPTINGQLIYKYSDILSNYNINSMTKQELINNIDGMNIVSISLSVYFMIFVYLFILYFMSIMMDVLILSLLVFIVSRFSRIKLKYVPSLSVAVHSITLPVILNLVYIIVNLLTGFEIKYFQVMYNTISYIYAIVAILMIKTDFINRQAELIKIAQEQMKIKEELEKQEEEQKKKEENKDKPVDEDNKKEDKKDSKNKKEKKSKKENKSSDEPIGDATIVLEEK